MSIEITNEQIEIWCHIVHGKQLTYGHPCIIKICSDGTVFGAAIGPLPVIGQRGDRFITTTQDRITGVTNSARNLCIHLDGFYLIDELGASRIRIAKPKSAEQVVDLDWMFNV